MTATKSIALKCYHCFGQVPQCDCLDLRSRFPQAKWPYCAQPMTLKSPIMKHELNAKTTYFQAKSATLSCILCLSIGTMSEGSAWWMQTESSCRATANFGAWGCHAKQRTTLLDLNSAANETKRHVSTATFTMHSTCSSNPKMISTTHYGIIFLSSVICLIHA